MSRSLLLTVLLLASSHLCFAQPAETKPKPEGPGAGPGPGQPPEESEGRPERPRGFMPPNLMFEAIDADKNGEISADELKAAVESLKKLDKNHDGKLTRDEVRPPFAGGGRGGRMGRRRGGEGGPRGFGGGFGGPEQFISRLMEHDKDKDGKLTKDELDGIPGAERMMEQGDTNGDKVLDKAELTKLAEKMSQAGGRGRRGRGGRGGRGPDGGPPEGGPGSDDKPEGNRPQRPEPEKP